MTEQMHPEPSTLPTEAEFTQVVAKANTGDKAALTKLRELLDDQPQIWKTIGDLAAHAESLLVGLIAAGNQLMVESLNRKLREMKAELLGNSPTMLERMAIERIVATWLAMQYVDTVVNQLQGGTLPNAHFQLKRQDAAHKRYAAAIKSLTDLRRLLPRSAGVVTPDTASAPLRVFGGEAEPPATATG